MLTASYVNKEKMSIFNSAEYSEKQKQNWLKFYDNTTLYVLWVVTTDPDLAGGAINDLMLSTHTENWMHAQAFRSPIDLRFEGFEPKDCVKVGREGVEIVDDRQVVYYWLEHAGICYPIHMKFVGSEVSSEELAFTYALASILAQKLGIKSLAVVGGGDINPNEAIVAEHGFKFVEFSPSDILEGYEAENDF